jgi:hypothetical protein
VSAPQEGQEGEKGRIVLFPPRISLERQKGLRKPVGTVRQAVEGLQKYEGSGEPDDYPRRMMINLMAFAFIVMLTLAGIWLAEQMALLRQNQNCVFSGRKNCPEIEVHTRDRRSGLDAVDHGKRDGREAPAQTNLPRGGG